jgi:hypothetical protein
MLCESNGQMPGPSATARPAKKATRKRKAAARKPARAKGSSIEQLARTIVAVTLQPDLPYVTLYTEDCVSAEPIGEPARGHAGLEEKNARWAQMQSSSTWKARNVWTGPSTICIEWDGMVQMRDGRLVNLREIAVHETRDGKIQNERYY